MALGTGIFLIVLGAILSWGITDNLDSVNLVVIGYICMVAGAIALALSVWMNAQRGKTTHHEVLETNRPDNTTTVTKV
jgi:divalent metal cation (Fe/Co/Zn/Cd) transporter